MTCHQVQSDLSFYLYGELSFAAEEALETHLAGCAFCQQALAREKEWHAAARSRDVNPSLALLSECRAELRKNLERLPKQAPSGRLVWRKIKAWFDVPIVEWASRGALACFLVILGFGMGRWAGPGQQAAGAEQLGNIFAPMLAPGVRVREVRAANPGQVRVVIERVREDQLLGPLNDERIRGFVLAATRHSTDPAVRMDSVQVLSGQILSGEVLSGQAGQDIRDALLISVRHDPNAAVRLKALEALRPFAAEASTRQTLRSVLETDGDPAVRSEAISVLVPPARDVEISPELLNTLEGVVHSYQGDDYVRARAMQVLQQAGAASDTY
jgi:anti-sigma factor RsiW